HYLERPVGRFRIHALQKTTAGNLSSVEEEVLVARRFRDVFSASELPRIEASYELDRLGARLAASRVGGWTGLRTLGSIVKRHPPLALRLRFARVLAYALGPRALVERVERRRLDRHMLGGGQPSVRLG